MHEMIQDLGTRFYCCFQSILKLNGFDWNAQPKKPRLLPGRSFMWNPCKDTRKGRLLNCSLQYQPILIIWLDNIQTLWHMLFQAAWPKFSCYGFLKIWVYYSWWERHHQRRHKSRFHQQRARLHKCHKCWRQWFKRFFWQQKETN